MDCRLYFFFWRMDIGAWIKLLPNGYAKIDVEKRIIVYFFLFSRDYQLFAGIFLCMLTCHRFFYFPLPAFFFSRSLKIGACCVSFIVDGFPSVVGVFHDRLSVKNTNFPILHFKCEDEITERKNWTWFSNIWLSVPPRQEVQLKLLFFTFVNIRGDAAVLHHTDTNLFIYSCFHFERKVMNWGFLLCELGGKAFLHCWADMLVIVAESTCYNILQVATLLMHLFSLRSRKNVVWLLAW